ncbi:hypothetical protein DPMN_102997 [Dreissena polymorpha]|uniref:Uncharacterized protein n=1 Tax=Dreissena polymorpha TaxID=45954 RepID=A0A9D4HAB5_DREPO|nr:hypothetical protein DPMN_102997 [Dreissena polymorpha]
MDRIFVCSQCIVVGKAFQGVLDAVRQERNFHVVYEMSLPVSCRYRNDMLKELRSTYNIEPRLLYLLKKRNRAQDFFHKINKDHNEGLSPDEVALLFKLLVSSSTGLWNSWTWTKMARYTSGM